MTNKTKVKLQSIKNTSEKDVLLFLKERGECVYGEIIKELQLSTTRGQEVIHSLVSQGFIKYVANSSCLKLDIDVKL